MVDISKLHYNAVIFDMDGTMIDNMMVHHRAWQQKLNELGLDLSLEEVKDQVHGVNEEIMERLFGDRFSLEERRFHACDKEARYREIFKDSLQLLDGLPKFLEFLQTATKSMAIGSAAPPENIDFVIDELNIRSLFEIILDSSHVTKGKPDPEIYLKIMEELSVNAKECLIFEDSVIGAEAAINAGAHTIVLTTTHKKDEFKHLPKILGFMPNFTNTYFRY